MFPWTIVLIEFEYKRFYSERPRGAGFRSVNPAERWRENPARALAHGSHRPWKVLEFECCLEKCLIFQSALKMWNFPWKVLENDYMVLKNISTRKSNSRSRRDVMRLSNKRSPCLFGVATANRTKVTTPNKYGAEIIARMSDWENLLVCYFAHLNREK